MFLHPVKLQGISGERRHNFFSPTSVSPRVVHLLSLWIATPSHGAYYFPAITGPNASYLGDILRDMGAAVTGAGSRCR